MIARADQLRRGALRPLMRVEPIRRIFVEPRRRIPAAEAVGVATSATLALWAPASALLLGAAFLGVPHVVAGVRHTVLRRGLHPVTLGCVLAALVAGIAAVAGLHGSSRVFILLFTVAMVSELLFSRGPAVRRVVISLLVATAAWAAWHAPFLFVGTVSYLHALGSVAFFAVAARRRSIPIWPLCLGTTTVAAGVLLGAVDGLFAHLAWAKDLQPALAERAMGIPVATADAHWLARGLTLYAFAQSLHYVIWLRLMPEVDRPSPVPWSFRRAAAQMEHELKLPLWLVGLACVAVSVGILVAGRHGRDLYFVLVYFHLGMEAAALTRLLARPAEQPHQGPSSAASRWIGRLSRSPDR